MDDEERRRYLEGEPPLRWLEGHLRRVWRRMVGPPPPLDIADIVPPDAWPVCAECVVAHHPLLRYCPTCGEPVGPYRAVRYMDFVWIWGRGLRRLVARKSVSRLVWFGLLCAGIQYLGEGIASILAHWFPGPRPQDTPAWAFRGETAVSAALGMAYAVLGLRFLSAAKRTWGSWREPVPNESTETASE
jgi:hypothetical protein